jgi:hypothetical protein
MRVASVGLIVLAPKPLAPGKKLVLRETESLTPKDNLFRAEEGDIGSFSTVVFCREGNAGTANVPTFSFAGPINEPIIEDAVPIRLCGEGPLTGYEVDIDILCPNSRKLGEGDEGGGIAMLFRSRRDENEFIDVDTSVLVDERTESARERRGAGNGVALVLSVSEFGCARSDELPSPKA